MPKLPYKEAKEYHLIVKEIKDFDDGLSIINKLPSVGITPYFCSYELGEDPQQRPNPHIHCYCVGLYTRRYYTDHIHEVFPNKYILKLVKKSFEDHEKLISYIFKDGNTYIDYTFSKHNIHYINDKNAIYKPYSFRDEEEAIDLYALYHKEQQAKPKVTIISYPMKPLRKPTKSYTQKLCDHFLDNKDEIYKKHPFTDLELENHEIAERTINEVMDYTNLSCKSIDKVIINRFVITVLNHIPKYRNKIKKSISSELKHNYF